MDKMPNVTQSESRESLLAMPSSSNVMEHKEMLIWNKQTWIRQEWLKSRSNDRFGLFIRAFAQEPVMQGSLNQLLLIYEHTTSDTLYLKLADVGFTIVSESSKPE